MGYQVSGKRSGPPPLRGPNPQGINVPLKNVIKLKKGGDPCWEGYEMVGMKSKGGRKVPNCVPSKKKVMKAYTGRAVKQPTETSKEFKMRHAYHKPFMKKPKE